MNRVLQHHSRSRCARLWAIFSLISFFALAAQPQAALAQIDEPVRSQTGLTRPKTEKAVKVRGAKVLIADYELIRKDFAQTRALTETEIDDWLIENAAYVTTRQVLGTSIVNSAIPMQNQSDGQLEIVSAFRPWGYGRALVIPTDGGLIDSKGAGTHDPRQRSHGNGLATAGEAVREFIVEKLVTRVLHDAYSRGLLSKPITTVGSYAALDLNFEIIHADGSRSEAGAYLRQAHSRALHTDTLRDKRVRNFFLDRKITREIESALRHYGITSASEAIVDGRDALNIQGTEHNELFDFGTFRLKQQFENPAYWYGDVKPEPEPNGFIEKIQAWFAPSRAPLIEKSAVVQPDAKLMIPMTDGAGRGKHDAFWIKAHDYVKRFKTDPTAKQDLREYVDRVLNSGGYIARQSGATALRCLTSALLVQ